MTEEPDNEYLVKSAGDSPTTPFEGHSEGFPGMTEDEIMRVNERTEKEYQKL